MQIRGIKDNYNLGKKNNIHNIACRLIFVLKAFFAREKYPVHYDPYGINFIHAGRTSDSEEISFRTRELEEN